jgi:hypothetical protein
MGQPLPTSARLPDAVKITSGFFQQAGNRDQNHRTDKRYDDRTDHAAALPDSQHTENPASQNAPEDPENNVHQHAVAAAFHNLAGKPTCDQSNDYPREDSHSFPPSRRKKREAPFWNRRLTENVHPAVAIRNAGIWSRGNCCIVQYQLRISTPANARGVRFPLPLSFIASHQLTAALC